MPRTQNTRSLTGQWGPKMKIWFRAMSTRFQASAKLSWSGADALVPGTAPKEAFSTPGLERPILGFGWCQGVSTGFPGGLGEVLERTAAFSLAPERFIRPQSYKLFLKGLPGMRVEAWSPWGTEERPGDTGNPHLQEGRSPGTVQTSAWPAQGALPHHRLKMTTAQAHQPPATGGPACR